MKRAAPAVLRLLTLGAATAITSPAGAALQPHTAEAQAGQALREGSYTFCRTSERAISPRVSRLCPYATEIPDCEGFAAACNKEPPQAPHLPAWLESLLGGLGHAASYLVWALVGILLLLIAVPVLRAVLRRGHRVDQTVPAAATAQAVPVPSVEAMQMTDAARLLADAEAAARVGDHDRAVALYLAASLRALDQRGAIRLAKHKTNGEYVRGCSDAGARAPLRDIVRAVDRVQFGGERADGAMVGEVATRAAGLVRVATLALSLLLLALTVSGCGDAVRRATGGGDPAGLALLLDVLHRQGADAAYLSSSLATLPIPKAGERTPIVVVDLERTPLEDDAWAHLTAWVRAGGALVVTGHPFAWPKAFEAKVASTSQRDVLLETTAERVEGSGPSPGAAGGSPAGSKQGSGSAVAGDDDDSYVTRDAQGNYHEYTRVTLRARLASPAAFVAPAAATTVARLEHEDGGVYAALLELGDGEVLMVANDDLLTNAGLARPGNAPVTIALLATMEAIHEVEDEDGNAPQVQIRLARENDGIAPPGNPFAALLRAGLGLAFVQGLLALLALFLAVGLRAARPTPERAPARRAFAEHVEATGALYADAKLAAHALVVYARYADGRLRARMPRSAADIPSFLAARAGADPATVTALWRRATLVDPTTPRGDELATLDALSALVSKAE